MSSPSPFATELARSISAYVRRARSEGTVSMSARCLSQCVRSPSPSLEGAPRGTNAQWVYAQAFRDALVSLPASVRTFAQPMDL